MKNRNVHLRPGRDVEYFNQFGKDKFPGFVGIEVTEVSEGKLVAGFKIQPHHFAPNEYLHAGTIVSLADTVAGYATVAHLPEGARSFTTIELKTNFMGTAKEGTVECIGEVEHAGRTTQVWRVIAWHKETGKKMAVFSCTQLILY